jgi:outer membrane protein assembly factor BamB
MSVETGLPMKWSDGENVAWKTAVPGAGWSSPIVCGGRVFVTAADDHGASCRVLCLDRKSGDILWNKEVFRQETRRKEAKNSYASPTPCTDGQRVYAVFADGSFAALKFDGSVAWTNRDFPYYSRHGLGGSPLLVGDLLVMAFDGSSDGDDETVGWRKPWDKAVLVALDAQTGKVRWKGGRGQSRIAHVTPHVLREDGAVRIISAAGDVVQGFNATDGQRLWTVRSQGEGVVPSVVIDGGLIFTASGFEDPTIRAIRPGGKGDVTATHLAWEWKKAVPSLSSFIYANDCLFTINEGGIAQCLEAASGKLLWQQRIGGQHSASPVCAEGRVYFLAEDGTATIVEAAREFKQLAQNRLSGRFQASCAVSGKQLFFRSDTHLYCVGGER